MSEALQESFVLIHTKDCACPEVMPYITDNGVRIMCKHCQELFVLAPMPLSVLLRDNAALWNLFVNHASANCNLRQSDQEGAPHA